MAAYTCQHCGEPFEASKPTARWCSNSCRDRAWRTSRREALSDAASEARSSLGAIPSALAAGDHARIGRLLARAELAIAKLTPAA